MCSQLKYFNFINYCKNVPFGLVKFLKYPNVYEERLKICSTLASLLLFIHGVCVNCIDMFRWDRFGGGSGVGCGGGDDGGGGGGDGVINLATYDYYYLCASVYFFYLQTQEEENNKDVYLNGSVCVYGRKTTQNLLQKKICPLVHIAPVHAEYYVIFTSPLPPPM